MKREEFLHVAVRFSSPPLSFPNHRTVSTDVHDTVACAVTPKPCDALILKKENEKPDPRRDLPFGGKLPPAARLAVLRAS